MRDLDRKERIRMKYLVICALFIAALAPAHAYIDAGSGSYVLQMAMAGVLALAFTVKLAWKRIRTFVSDLMNGRRHANTHGGQ